MAPRKARRRVAVVLGLVTIALALFAGVGCEIVAGLTDRHERPTPVRPDGGAPDSGPCAAGEKETAGGLCVPAGVPQDGCGEGFKTDGDGGCVAILPADPCPSGTMAIPGEKECGEVAPCGDGDYGDIPVDATTQFVNKSYGGENGPSDGTQARPWTAIQDGIDAAAEGAIVAVAGGDYPENVVIQDKPVLLWGRCPSEVEIDGTDPEAATVTILDGADATEVHAVAVTGAGNGIFTSGSTNVAFERLWIHDTVGRGFDIENVLGASTSTILRCLFERTADIGVVVVGSEVILHQSVIRGTLPRASTDLFGRGLQAQMAEGVRPAISMIATVIEANLDTGVSVFGTDIEIEGSVVRGTLPSQVDDSGGEGIAIQRDPAEMAPSNAIIRTSLIESNRTAGVVISASNAEIEGTVVRGTSCSAADKTGGDGVIAVLSSTLVFRSSLVEDCATSGVLVDSSSATFDAVRVRRISPECAASSRWGDGLRFLSNEARAEIVVQASRIETNSRAGISAFGAAVALGDTRFECNAFDLQGDAYNGYSASFDNLGGNVCGCSGEQGNCQVIHELLSPADFPQGAP